MLYTFLFTVLIAAFPLLEIHALQAFSSPSIEVPSDEVPSDEVPSGEVPSEKALIDEDIGIVITGLQPNERIQIQASTVDDNSMKWVSQAFFEANKNGIVDLSKQSPISGTYEGVDPEGLLWSMQPETSETSSFKIKKDEVSLCLKVFRAKQEIASKVIIRLRKSPDVKQISVHDNGLVGLLFLPPSEKPLPVIITLSGSNGGFSESRAQLLASHGFAVLALAYFGVEGLPQNLQNIPLEYFEKAFSWIKTQRYLDASHVGIYAVSRGAELALILGSWFPESVQAIVAVAPSSVIYGGTSETPVNAWVYQGKPLAPPAPTSPIDYSNNLGCDLDHPANTLGTFLERMKNEKAYCAALIPVEKIQASLLVISGGDDQMWPSTIYASQIEERLQKNKSPIHREYLQYPKAGHGINIPNLPQPGPVYYHPVAKKWFSMGGSVAEDQHASQDSWKKLIQFFDKALK